jgi:hypothetical protein
MLSPVSTSDPRQNVQSLLVKTDQPPSTLNAQRAANTEQNQMRSETQNSQQAEGASHDVRASFYWPNTLWAQRTRKLLARLLFAHQSL